MLHHWPSEEVPLMERTRRGFAAVMAVGLALLLGGPGPAVALRDGSRHGLGKRELAAVPLPEEIEPLRRLEGQVFGLEQPRILPPAQHPGDEQAARAAAFEKG